MAFADANRAQIRTVEEVVWGTTPASGTSREMRLTSSSLSASKETAVSDELRADRMVPDIVETAASSSGEINFEWSSGPQDEFLAGFLLSAWTRPMSMDFWKGSIVTVSANDTVTLVGVDATPYITVGRVIKTVGFVAAANNGYFTVDSVTLNGSNTDVVLTGVTTLVAESGTNAARFYDANDVIVNGNTTVSATAAGFAGTGVFTSAIAAGQLQVGQQVTVEGLGYDTGVVTFASSAASTFAVDISDGVNTRTITTTTDFAPGASNTDSATAFAAFLNGDARTGTNAINVKATVSGGAVTITNLNAFETDAVTLERTKVTGAGSITETVADGNVTVSSDFTGSTGARGVFKITGVADDLLSVSPSPSTFAAGQEVVIKGSHLRNSGNVNAITQRSWSIETAFTDISQFKEQDGMVVGTVALEIASGSILTGTFGFEGRATSLRQSTLLGGGAFTQQEAQPGAVSNATTDVGNIEKDGTTLPACVQSLSLSGEAGLRMQNCVGSKYPRGIGTGRFNLSGSATIYFENESLFNDFIEHNTLSLGFSVADAENVSYYFRIPAAKFSADEIAPGGIDQDVFENIEWTAFRDPATNTMFMMDRFSNDAAV